MTRFLIIFAALVLFSCAGEDPTAVSQTPAATPRTVSCAELYPDFVQQLDDYAAEWVDAIAVASRTSRVSLSDHITDMQAIRRSVRAIEPPKCGELAHKRLVQYMDHTIDLFLDFLASEEEIKEEDLAVLVKEQLKYADAYLIMTGDPE